MVEGLNMDLHEKIGIKDCVGRAYFLPEKEYQIKFHKGINYITGSFGFGILSGPGRIAWYVPGRSAPVPVDQPPPEGLRLWWDILPMDVIKDEMHREFPKPYAEDEFPFSVEWRVLIGVDWHVRITGEPGKLKYLQTKLPELSDEYNSGENDDDFQGHIHSLREVIQLDEGIYLFSGDFGSASTIGLKFLLDRLEMDIVHVRVTP